MRVYLPATAADLSADAPPTLRAFTVIAPPGIRGEDLEVLEDDAQDEAAVESLRRLRDETPGAAPRRVILAADIHPGVVPEPTEEGSTTGVIALDSPVPWSDVRALLVDEDAAASAVGAVLAADDQEAADEALAALWDRPLQWFDATERELLAERWNARA